MKVNWAGQNIPDDDEYGGRPEHIGRPSIKEIQRANAAKARAALKAKLEAKKLREAQKGVLTTAKIFGNQG